MNETELPTKVTVRRLQVARTAERTCGLLQEYAGKLHHISDRLHTVSRDARDLRHQHWVGTESATHEATSLMRRFTVIASSAEQLARTTSGLIEGAALSLPLKYELLLRSREFENALTEAREAVILIQRRGLTGVPLNASLREVPIPDLAARHRELDQIVPQPAG